VEVIRFARRVVFAMSRAVLTRYPEEHHLVLVVHCWERPSPHTAGWRL
jgi:hypothetical protein